MKRHRQSLSGIQKLLGEVPGVWEDAVSEKALAAMSTIREKAQYSPQDLLEWLQLDFPTHMLLFQLILDISKDEWRQQLRKAQADTRLFRDDPIRYVTILDRELGVTRELSALVNRKWTWADILRQRLKSGRGSAIKGQTRGRFLENFAEKLIKEIRAPYETRCTFTGRDGVRAKADFALPNKEQPQLVIECKGYGSTGSKQTDIMGDILKVIAAKRGDTVFLLITDGLSWLDRLSDLRKLLNLQGEGHIYRIYTQAMRDDLRADLHQLKRELAL